MTTPRERIDAAIWAHFAWFKRLREAVVEGESRFPPESLERDNQCDLGKWIYDDLGSICDRGLYNRIRETHATFHRQASQVLRMALDGDTTRAAKEIEVTSELGKLSGRLVMLLRRIAAG
ncbi:MAG: CZB domain-containing protein [Pseudomonadota bacterium]